MDVFVGLQKNHSNIYLKTSNYNVENCVLCFDGIMIPKNANNNQKLLDDLSKYVVEKTGFNIQFDWKTMIKPTFKPKKLKIDVESTSKVDIPPIKIDATDDTLAKLFKYYFGNKFIFINDNFYYFNDTFWIFDDKKFIISSFIAEH